MRILLPLFLNSKIYFTFLTKPLEPATSANQHQSRRVFPEDRHIALGEPMPECIPPHGNVWISQK
jgi:hypothetical protein